MAPDGEVVKPYVIWFDPGAVTGAASYDLEHGVFESWQADRDDVVRRLHDEHKVVGDRMQIGWEMYLSTGGPQHGTSKYSNEMIGRLRDFAFVHDVEVLKPQPSVARKLGSKVMLRRLGWYKPGQDHANDAAMHTLSYLLRLRPMPLAIRASLFPGYTSGVSISP